MKRSLIVVLVVMSQVLSSCVSKPIMGHETAAQDAEAAIANQARSPSAEAEETPWTTWSSKGKVGGLLVLKGIRETLLNKNLHDPHVNYSSHAPVDCSKSNTKFRSADGTCNDLNAPLVGAAGVAFGRNIAPEYIDQDADKKLMEPNPSLVSKEFFSRDIGTGNQYKEVPFLNMIAAVWIQFMNHDWLTHGKNVESSPYRVDKVDGNREEVERTKENPLNPGQYKSEYKNKVTLNDVTHWWDASQIYGSSQAEQDTLRSFSRGRMKTEVRNGQELLPFNSSLDIARNKQNQGHEMTGFKDNWWLGLSMLHTLFVKEHNAIADMLIKEHVTYDPKEKVFIWSNGKKKWITGTRKPEDVLKFDEKQLDEHIFQTARLVNSAILAKIHTVEWTPAILANETLKIAMNANWYGAANPNSWSRFLKKFPGMNKTDWFKTRGGYLIGGIVGDKTNNFGVPFSITEEFTSVYRLHSLLPEKLDLKNASNSTVVESLPFPETRNEKAYAITEKYPMKDLYYSFGTQLPGQLVLNNFPKFMQALEIPGHGVMDLGMVDVLRDRERAVPRYNQFRRAINLKPISKYMDFFPGGKVTTAEQRKVLESFYRVYGKTKDGRDNVEAIDLLVGTLAEEVRPKNYGFGETMFQIFILMASRRLMADRFFTDDYNVKNYSRAGMAWIDDEGTMSQVIVRHMPELKKHVKGLETAFAPWNK